MDDESDAGVEAEEAEEVDGGAAIDTGVEEDESLSSEDSDDDTADVEEDEPDWKAIAEQERVKAENYKKALTQKRQLRKQAPKVEEPEENDFEEDEDDESRPITLKDLEIRDAKKTVDSTLSELVKDPEKRKLVKLYYDTRIRQTGTSDDAIRSDLETALDLADVKHLRKTNKEIARTISQDKTPPLGGSGSDRSPAPKGHKFSDEQVRTLTETAKRIGADPKKFIADAYKNQQAR